MPNPSPEVPEPTDATLRRRIARMLLAAGAALLAALALAGFAFADPAAPSRLAAPAFSLTAFDGTPIDLATFEGKPIVINAWASWCPPCREEAPTLRRVYEGLGDDGVAFLGIVSDDTAGPASSYAAEAGLTFPHAIDDGTFDAAYRIEVLPTTYVIDIDGNLVAKHAGPISEARLRVLIDEARTGLD
jgi:thiol-disulfide isomerase/thioredoxin